MAFVITGDAATNRTNLGLGTAATLNVGTSANNIVQLDASGNLPAIDGSSLTGISSYADSDALSLFNASGAAPVYACRAWVSFNGTGTVAIRGSGNVSSITDHATGEYSVNFSTSMSDANYSIIGGAIGSNGNWAYTVKTNNSSISTSSARFATGYSNDNYLYDVPYVHVAVFR